MKNLKSHYVLAILTFVFLNLNCKKEDKSPVVQTGTGTQVWAAKNLDVETYRNGNTIPQVTDPTQWDNLTTGAWCYYNNDPANGIIYGKLYNWYAIHDPRGLAPQGWHIPDQFQWDSLFTFLGGTSLAGGKMKATTLWDSPNVGATNSSGFSALPGGQRYYGGVFGGIGKKGYWWSYYEINSYSAYGVYIYNDAADAPMLASYKQLGFSVRCLKD